MEKGRIKISEQKLYQIHIRIKPFGNKSYFEHIYMFVTSTKEPELTISECSVNVEHKPGTYKELIGKTMGD